MRISSPDIAPFDAPVFSWPTAVRVAGLLIVALGAVSIAMAPMEGVEIHPGIVGQIDGEPAHFSRAPRSVAPDSAGGIAIYGGGFLLVALGGHFFWSGRLLWGRSVRRARVRAETTCPACGYEAWRSRSRSCPECGQAIPRGTARA